MFANSEPRVQSVSQEPLGAACNDDHIRSSEAPLVAAAGDSELNCALDGYKRPQVALPDCEWSHRHRAASKSKI
jgi:hypothetical protein